MPGGGSKPGERRGGRKKGTPNKGTIILRTVRAACEAEGIDPVVMLVRMSDPEQPIEFDFPELRAKVAMGLLEFMQPKIVRNELTGANGGAVQMEMFESPTARISSKLDRIAARASEGSAGRPDGSGSDGA
jgi:hypothetical protein